MLFLTFLALVAAPLAAQAFTVETPLYWLSNTTVIVNWTSVTTDPEYFSIELFNPVLLPTGPFGIADTVDAYLFTYGIPLPRVTPGDGYYFAFVNTGNINQVYIKSGFFSILQNDVPSGSSQLATTSSATRQSRSEGSITSTTTANGTSTTAVLTSTTLPLTTKAAPVDTTAVAQPSQFGSGKGKGFTSFSNPSKWSLLAAIGALAFASL